jgi:8-oxo-dGTP pyrophosphatase MutT (NUDIX family)
LNTHERVDLVDANGVPKLFGVSRLEVRQRKNQFVASGLFQPIVIVVALDAADRIVAQVRGAGKAGDGDGEIDHVCGVIASGETWETAAHREAKEEIGVELPELTLVAQSINSYNRHRTLAVSRINQVPSVIDPNEVARIFRATPGELLALDGTGDAVFVKGFFSDMKLALERIGVNT